MGATPLNYVSHTGPPLDHSQQNEANLVLKNHPSMVFLPQPTTMKELNSMPSDTKDGIVVSGGAASGQIWPLIGSSDISESEDGFLFRVVLPDIEKNEKFKCDVEEGRTITINGTTSTGRKMVHSHNMVFDMNNGNLWQPGGLSVSFKLPAHVDPTTLELVLDNGVLEGLSRRNRSNMDWADQAPIAVAPLNSVPYTGPPFDTAEQNQALNHPTMVMLHESTTVEELQQILSIQGFVVEGAAAGDLLGPLIGAFDVSDSDDGFLFRVALPGVEKNEKFKCAVQEDGTVKIEGASNTGGKTVHSHNMVFEMHTQNLCPPGDLTVSFKLPGHVDPATLERCWTTGFLKAL